MIKENIRYFKYNRIIKDANKFIYHDKNNNRMIKLDKDCTSDMQNYHSIMISTPSINESQIEELSSKQKYIHNSSLPEGIIYYSHLPVGVIYPNYFEGYKTFEELFNEDVDLIIYNLKQAYYNNLELIHNNIYNKDFAFKNIMYKGGNVELVDLDGKLIGNKNNTTYTQMYSYFMYDLYRSLKKKIEELYKKDSSDILNEIKYNYTTTNTIDFPLEIINKIEMKRILK